MLRRTFRAMGTEVELFLDAEPSAESERALDAAEPEFERLEALLSRFRPDSELSRAQPRGRARRRRPTSSRSRARRSTRGSGPAASSTRPSTTRSSRPATTARSTRSLPTAPATASRPCGGGVRDRRARGSSSSRLPARPRRDREGLRRRPRRRILVAAGPCLVNAGGDIAVPRPAAGRSASRPADGELTLELERGAIATSGRDRRRWRRDGAGAPPPDRPRDRRARRGDLLRVTVVAPTAVEAEVLAKAVFLGAAPCRSRRRPCWSPPTAAPCSPGGSHEDRPDVLAARARERADRLRAADDLGARRADGEVPAARQARQGGGRHRPPPLPVAARARRGRAPRARARRSTRPCRCRSRRCSSPGSARTGRSRPGSACSRPS